MGRITILTAALFVSIANIASAGGGGKLPFKRSYDRQLLEARRLGKPLVVYFTATW